MKETTISKGFVLAGLMNSSVLLFSRFFTNPVIPEADPNVMSNFGLVMILVWGLAYISVAKSFSKVKWLVGVFAIEKVIYVGFWIFWLANHNLGEVYDKDFMAGLFYSLYGVNDSIFLLFFVIVFLRLQKSTFD